MDDIVERLRNHTEGNDMVTHEVVNDAADEIERLRDWLERTYRLAVGHGPNWKVFDSWEEAIHAYEEARRG